MIAAVGSRCRFALAWLLSSACAGPAAQQQPLAAPAASPPSPSTPAARRVPTPNVTRSVREIAANPSRGTLVTITSDRRLAIVRDGAERSWPLADLVRSGYCGSGYGTTWSRVGVSADGAEAWFSAVQGRKQTPTYIVSAECLVDLETGAARSLRAALREPWHLPALGAEPTNGLGSMALHRRFALLWGGGADVLELVWRDTELSEYLKLGGTASDCAATVAGTELMVACRAAEWRVQVARFDVSSAPHRFLMNEAVRVHTRRPALRASADGRFVAFYDEDRATAGTLGVIDTADAHLRFEVPAPPRLLAVDFLVGADVLLVVDEEASARLLDLDGRVQERFHFEPSPTQLFPMPDRHVWCDGDSGLELYAF